MAEIGIYGAGGFAREVAWLVECISTPASPLATAFLIDDNPDSHGTEINGIPVVGFERAETTFPDALIVGGVGASSLRQKLMERVAVAGFESATLVHPNVQLSRFVTMGMGTVICAGNILTTNIRLGRHVQINLDCTIGHDVEIDDYATLAPGVHVSGWVRIGKRAYVGTGANIINGTSDAPLVIGDDTVVGAGACVTKSLDSSVLAVGMPAKVIKQLG